MHNIILFIIFVSIFSFPITSCSQTSGQYETEFTLKTNESKKIGELEIKLNRVGRKWLANGGGESIDLQYTATYKGKSISFNETSKNTKFEDYSIEIVKADVFGSDGVIFRVGKVKKSETKTAKPGEKFTLNKGEGIAVKDTNISFIFNSLEYEVTRSTDGREVHYHRLNIEQEGSKKGYIVQNNEARFSNFVIYIESPLDELPMTFIIFNAPKTELEAAKQFVERFGWHIDEAIEPAKVAIEFPKEFTGLPFYHYQSASLRSGVDMTPLAGKKFEMLRYTIREKEIDRKQEITAFAHLIIENKKVIGAWRTDSSSREPGIYSFEMKNK